MVTGYMTPTGYMNIWGIVPGWCNAVIHTTYGVGIAVYLVRAMP